MGYPRSFPILPEIHAYFGDGPAEAYSEKGFGGQKKADHLRGFSEDCPLFS